MLKETELVEIVLDVKEWLEHARVHTTWEKGRGAAYRNLLMIERDLAERMPTAYRSHVAEREEWLAP